MARNYMGNVMATEPDFDAVTKRGSYRKLTMVVVIIWAVVAVMGAYAWPILALQLIIAFPFAILALYFFAASVRFKPVVVYEYGIEWSDGPSRQFFPWGRLMWGWEDAQGLHLRIVHGIEAAVKLLDDGPSVRVIIVPVSLPNYYNIRDYVLKVLPEAHWAQGTKWRWENAPGPGSGY